MGVLGEYKGSQAREVMITLEDWQSMFEAMEQGEEYEDDDEYEYVEEEVEEEVDEEDEEAEPAYVTEGQREYMAVEDDEYRVVVRFRPALTERDESVGRDVGPSRACDIQRVNENDG